MDIRNIPGTSSGKNITGASRGYRRLFNSIAPAFLFSFLIAASAPAAVLKSVQRGDATIAAGSTTTTVTVNSIDPTKALLIFTASTNNNSPINFGVGGEITDGATLTFQRNGTTATVNIHWQVFEFSSGVTVQRGTKAISATPIDTNITLTAVDLSKSFPIVTYRSDGGTYGGDDPMRAELTTTTNLFIDKTAKQAYTLYWQVVQYDNCSVQKISTTGWNTTSTTATIPIAVTTGKTMLVTTYNTGGGQNASYCPKVVLTNGTTITYTRTAATTTLNMLVYAVAFTGSETVTHGDRGFVAGDVEEEFAISSVDLPTTGVFGTGNFFREGRSSEADDNMGACWYNYKFTSPTTLNITRAFGSTTGTDSTAYQIVSFAGEAPMVWDGGGGSGSWIVNANWAGDPPNPDGGENIVFAGTVQTAVNHNYTAGTSYNSFTFSSGASAFTLSGNSITLTGPIINNDNDLQTINVNMAVNATATVYSASGDITIGGIISGAGGLTKSGTATLTLSGTNSYTGATTLSGGTLLVTGATNASSAVTVSSGATLGGNGTVNGAITLNTGGTLAPGTGGTTIGTLHTGNVTMAGSPVYSVDIDGATPTYDQISSTGTVALGAGTATLNVASIVNSSYLKVYPIISATSVTGTFSGMAENSTFVVSGVTLQINYTATQVTLTDIACTDPAPTINTQPSDVVVDTGEVASFTVSVSVSGVVPLTYQWQRCNDYGFGNNWVNVTTGTGGTTANYQLTTVFSDSNAYFRCVVSACGTVTSDPAVLKVCNPVTITTQPSATSVNVGSTATFTVAAIGSGLAYQWQSDSSGTWAPIAGATSATCNVVTDTADTSVHYRCMVTGACGSVATSNSAGITLCFVPVISVQPVTQDILDGQPVSFSVTATGRGTLSYQWQVSKDTAMSWSDTSGKTSSTFSTTATLAESGTMFRCKVTSVPCGTVYSSGAMLNVCSLPSVTSLTPLAPTVYVGDSVQFTVAATGSGLTYQWQRSKNSGTTWSDISGAVNFQVWYKTDSSDTNLRVRAIALGGCSGRDTSDAAAVTLCYSVVITTQPADVIDTAGQTVSFSAAAAGTGLNYKWQRMPYLGIWADCPEPNNQPTYTLTTTIPESGDRSADSGSQFRCVISRLCGASQTSSIAMLKVNTTPIITRDPANTSVTVGQPATFTVQARGTISSYQWQRTDNGGALWTNTIGTDTLYSFTTSASDTGALVKFRCVVAGPTGSDTSLSAQIGLCFPAAIQTNPLSITVTSGNPASFTVGATGTGLAYQWDSTANGSDWFAVTGPGGTSTTYGRTAVASTDSGLQYRCRVTASCGTTATSTAAILNVCTPAAISAQPANTTVSGGANASFSVTATGTGPFSYQWQRSRDNGTNWTNATEPSATTANLTVVADTADTNALFRCGVSASCGAVVTSSNARLTVCYPIVVNTHPSNTINVPLNSSQTFSTRATGVALSYQWEQSTDHGTMWSAIAGQTDDDYTVLVGTDSVMFRCKITATCTTAYSGAALVVICYPPSISAQPSSTTVSVSDTASFSITASGTGTLTYQWQRRENGGSVWSNVGTSSTSYKFVAAQADSNAGFRCIVSNCGSVTSNVATLTTGCVPTVVTVEPRDTTANVKDSVSFTVTATGKMLDYRWQRSSGGGAWNDIAGAVAARYAFKSDTVDTNTTYRCVVGGTCGQYDTSEAAAVTLCFPVTITTHPMDQSVIDGGQASFTVVGAGKNVSYQWQRSENGSSVWSNVGTNSPAYGFSCIPADSGAKFRCVVTSSPCGSAISNSATLTVCVPTVIFLDPQSQTVVVGDTAKFTVGASGNNLGYQWQISTNGGVNWTTDGLATTNSYNFKTDSTQTNVQVRCIASGVCNRFDTSNAAALTLCYAAAVVTPPASQSVTAGQQATFTIGAVGSSLSYQWQRDGTNLIGENSASYTITTRGPDTGSVSPDSGAQIRCVVTSSCDGSDTSIAAVLNVCTPPSIVTDPVDASGVKVGEAATFTVAARGTGLAYQWQRSDDSGTTWQVAASTSPVFSFVTQATDTGARVQFRCVVNGPCGSVTSMIVRVGLCFPASIVEHPADTEVTNGLSAAFRVRATGTGLAYQWQQSTDNGTTWTPYSGMTASTLTFAVSAADHGRDYRCVVNASCGDPDTSTAAKLTVCMPVAIISQPRDTMVVKVTGDTAVFRVGVSGTLPAFQWQKSLDNGSAWTPVAGATDSVCRVKVDTVDTAALFRCMVTGKCGTSMSNTARLRICYPIAITQQPADGVNIRPGDLATFSVRATGFSLTYQWERSVDGGVAWDTAPGLCRSSDYTFFVSALDHGFKYRCRISTICNPQVSNPATLTVCAAPLVTTQPANQGVIEGNSASFSIVATGSNRSYQWIRKARGATAWDTIGNAIDTFYTFATKLTDDSTSLRCVVTGSCGVDTSKAAVLAVYQKAKAWFTMSDTIGPAPFEVRLTDSSSGDVSQLTWVYGDGASTAGRPKRDIQIHRYDSVKVYTIKLVVQGNGGIDSVTRTLTVYSKTGNPIMLRGRYLSPDSVELVLSNYDSLRTIFPSPFVSSVRLWYQNGALPADTTLAKVLDTYGLAVLKARGSQFGDTVKVPRLQVPDTSYGFMTQVVWNDGSKTPFSPVNGFSVIMRDTARPSNGMALSGKYSERDTVTFYADSVQKIDMVRSDSIGLWFGLGIDSVPNFGNAASVKWWSVTDFLAGAAGNRVNCVVKNERFNTDRKMVHGALVVLGKNKLRSPVVKVGFMIGRVRPLNPIVLSATALTPGAILLSWKPVADSVEKIRIYYRSGAALPVDEYDYSGFAPLDSIVFSAQQIYDTSYYLANRTPKTRYYFAAQTYKDGMWTRVTLTSSANDSTPESGPPTIINSISGVTAKWDSVANNVRVYWQVDMAVGSGLEVGYTFASAGTGGPRDTVVRFVKSVSGTPDSESVGLGGSILFDKDYYIYLWLRKGVENWTLPTQASTAMVHTAPFIWQNVSYSFTPVWDTAWAANGTIRLITSPVTQTQVVNGKIQAFRDSLLLSGFVKVGQSFEFTERQQSDPFDIAIKYTLPQGFTWDDVKIYRYTGTTWFVERGTQYDTANSYAYLHTNDLTRPFAALVDTQPPSMKVLSDIVSAVPKNVTVIDTVIVADNTGNLQWRYRCAQGGDLFASGDTTQGLTLKNGVDTARVFMQSTLVSADNGVRAFITADDGRFAGTANLSRQVVRDSSDAVATPEQKWMPLRVTAVLDSPSAKQLLRYVDTSAAAPKYDNRYMRLFRWYPNAANLTSREKWVEYGSPALDTVFEFRSGRLFWIKTRKPVPLDFGRAKTTSQVDTAALRLEAKTWTDFALPFRYNMKVGDILAASALSSGKKADSLQIYHWVKDSATGKYLCQPFFIAGILAGGLDSLSRVMSCRDELSGFAVYNPSADAVQLRIPPVSETMSKVTGLGKKALSDAWTVKVVPRTEDGGTLTPVYCGYSAEKPAGTSWFPSAPSLGVVGAGVYEQRTGTMYGHSVVHDMHSGGRAYLLMFSNSDERARTVSITLERFGAFLPQTLTTVYNAVNGETAAITTGEVAVTVDAGSTEYRWLFVGDANYIASAVHQRASLKLALTNVYPNPVRRFVHLQYTLPFARVARVEFTVCDMLGRQIWKKSVREESVLGGRRDYVWYSTGTNGRRVAAGVYILKMTAFNTKGKNVGAFDRRLTVMP